MVFLPSLNGPGFLSLAIEDSQSKDIDNIGKAWLGKDMRRPHAITMSADERFFCHSPMATALPVDSFVGWKKLTEFARRFASEDLKPA